MADSDVRDTSKDDVRPPRYTPSRPRNGDDQRPSSSQDDRHFPAEQRPVDNSGEAMGRIDDMVSRHKEDLQEEERQIQSLRGLIIETINVLYREYNVRSLKYFRMRVEDARTMAELRVAADMLLTIGRFHEMRGGQTQRA